MIEEDMINKMLEDSFKERKESITKFIQDNLKPCQGFLIDLAGDNDDSEIVKTLKHHREEIYERLGGDSKVSEISDLEDEVEELECKVERLESEVEELSGTLGNSMDDVYKLEFLHQYHKDYTCWEIEELLKNGKEYLKNKL